MSSKQKLTISIVASIMALVIIGLTIAIVMVASMVTTTASMVVKFTSYEVDATIAASAYIVENAEMTSSILGTAGDIVTIDGISHPTIKTPEDGVLKFEAGEESSVESPKVLEFNEYTLNSEDYKVRYEFTITNTSNKEIQVRFAFSETTSDNMLSYVVCNDELITSGLEDGYQVVYYNMNHNDQITINYLIFPEDPSKDGTYSEEKGGMVQISLNGDKNSFVSAS